MDGLTIEELEQIYSLAIKSKCDHVAIKHIENFIDAVPKEQVQYTLTAIEIKELSVNTSIRFMIILYFLTKNISLEFLRKRNQFFKGDTVLVKDIWNDIEPILIKKILLSRELNAYFKDKGNTQSEEFILWLSAAKTLIIDDIAFEEFIDLNENHLIRLYLNGTYKFEEVDSSNQIIKSDSNEFIVHDRRTCFLQDLYDPFKFEESQTRTAYRYITRQTKKLSTPYLHLNLPYLN